MTSPADWSPAQTAEIRAAVVVVLAGGSKKIICPVDQTEIRPGPSNEITPSQRVVSIICPRCGRTAMFTDL